HVDPPFPFFLRRSETTSWGYVRTPCWPASGRARSVGHTKESLKQLDALPRVEVHEVLRLWLKTRESDDRTELGRARADLNLHSLVEREGNPRQVLPSDPSSRDSNIEPTGLPLQVSFGVVGKVCRDQQVTPIKLRERDSAAQVI